MEVEAEDDLLRVVQMAVAQAQRVGDLTGYGTRERHEAAVALISLQNLQRQIEQARDAGAGHLSVTQLSTSGPLVSRNSTFQ